MTAPHVHRQPCVRTSPFRFCVRRLAVIATLCVIASHMDADVGADLALSPSATAPQSAGYTAGRCSVRRTAADAEPSMSLPSIPNNSDHTARTHIYSYANQGHFIAINATPMQLLQYAYNLPGSRILGASGWTTSSKYDIEAKSDPALADKLALLPYPDAKDQLLKMVQLLLADRFHLAAHRESRELPVYELVAAKGRGEILSRQGRSQKHRRFQFSRQASSR